ncbi:hypothetical protein CALCODRAFT_206027 [Calocera cornea HHB12733]|uniref:MYND-type domain-containing protein n=1 Tax=Calocera cornea HHB12733 TaxID=1353952 RepID=A0A165K183_9BASI|nr:hypothetical protein CALCODRAFT_206027 [Calocera cornea HHB12733]
MGIIVYKGDRSGQLRELYYTWLIALLGNAPHIDIVTSRLCALYMPHLLKALTQLKQRLRDKEDVVLREKFDAIISLITLVRQQNRYFVRLVLSGSSVVPEVNLLAKLLAEYLIGLQVPWHRIFDRPHNDTSSSTQLNDMIQLAKHVYNGLFSLLRVQIDSNPVWIELDPIIPEVLKAVDHWSAVFDEYGDLTDNFRDLLARKERMVDISRRIRDNQIDVSHCAYPCWERSEKPRQCSRCRLAVYCTVEHQKQHWDHREGAHRAVCYTMEF